MPYCRKCGAQLSDDARFCHVCGTPVTSPVAGDPRTAPLCQPVRKATFPLAAIILIAIMIFSVVAAVVVLLPFQPVEFNQQNEASAANVNSLHLNLEADIADINVNFRDLPGNQRVIVNVSATGWRGIFASDQPVTLAFKEESEGATLTYTGTILRVETWPSLYSLDVKCDVYVDPAANLNLSVRTSSGRIVMSADQNATFQGINLETTAGSVELFWNDAEVAGDIQVNLKTTAGGIVINVAQKRELSGNVTLNAETTAGGIVSAVNVRDNVGAKIEAITSFGETNVRQQGFSGNQSPLQSSNYPAGSNFIINLETGAGGIDIDADYGPTGVRS